MCLLTGKLVLVHERRVTHPFGLTPNIADNKQQNLASNIGLSDFGACILSIITRLQFPLKRKILPCDQVIWNLYVHELL